MRSHSILLASAFALGALAKPLEKRVMVTEIDLEIVTVTKYVTAGQPEATPVASKEEVSTNPGYYVPKPSTPSSLAPVSTSPQAPPKPSFASTQGYVVAPAPSSSSSTSSSTPAPAPEPSTSSVHVPAPEPSTSSNAAATPSANPALLYGVEHKSGDQQAYLHEGTDYQNAILWHHNRARANHDASNLEWSTECASAAATAAAHCDFTHHVVDGQGQNLFTVSGDAYNATAGITEWWYKGEADIYKSFEADPDMANFHSWGHLTQMLWKETTHVGCVTIDCGSAMTIDGEASDLNLYTVCNYSPPGNYAGQYAENVGAPRASYNGYSWAD